MRFAFQARFWNRSPRWVITWLTLVLLKSSLAPWIASGQTAGSSDANRAEVNAVEPGQVHWTRGFWAQRFELCRNQIIPGMWRLMEGTNYSQYLENFRIAAGLSEGRHRGAAFNDGDFYKLLEAASAVLAVARDSEWEGRIDEAIAILAKAQRADGYLHTPVQIANRSGDTNKAPFQERSAFELYNFGHLFSSACVHHRATGKTNLLAVARRAADFLCREFGEQTPEVARGGICPSHYLGLIELFRETGDARYVDLARNLFDQRSQITDGGDDNQDRLPFLRQTNAMGHAVRANYLYAGAAELYLQFGDPELKRALERIWTNVVQQKLYITGGCGALYDGASPDGSKEQRSITRVHQAYGRNYQLPNITAHNETCANIGNVLWNWRMFRMTAEARYLDVLERSLYNSVLSGVSLDGTNFFYVNPLRTLSVLPTDLRWPRERVPYLSSFCCPPNLARIIAQAGSFAYGISEDTIWINLYGANTLTTTMGENTVQLTQESDYPWNGRIRLHIDKCSTHPFAVKLRIPGWAKSAAIRYNHAPLRTGAAPGSFLEVRRDWRPGDMLELDLEMAVEILSANPLVEESLNQVALKRGPLVYCLESIDLPAGARLTDVGVQPGLPWRARYDQRLLGGVAVLEGNLILRTSEAWGDQLYRETKTSAPRLIPARLIPYFAWANRGKTEMTVWLPER
jgi:DUF1680 family protein